MPINPVQFAHSVCDEFLRYLFSAFPLSDPELAGYLSMWKHQQQVLEAVKTGNHVLVSTGTGSGKTEAFLYPIVDDLLRQRDKGITTGLTAILIYPMNALANDQLDRLRDMLGGTGITFGQWVGTTPD